MGDDFLRAQLRQAQDALATAERLRTAAEAEYRVAVEKLGEIARSLLPAEWNGLRREHPGAASWPPQRLAGWIVETGRRKLNRLELLTQGDLAVEVETLSRERDELAAQLGQAREELAALESGCRTAREQVRARDAELARLRGEVVSLREERRGRQETPASGAAVPAVATTAAFVDADLAAWQASASFEREREALRAIGARGFCLRADVAGALGIEDATSGTARQVFDGLKGLGLIEEDKPRMESVGQTPYLLRLTARGREVYRALFGGDAVESEYDRLLARHKSAEHVLLNLQARDVLLAAGAESVDLYPRPVPLPGGGTFDVDLVAVFDGLPLYVEAERGSAGKYRPQKWCNYAVVTKDFYVVVPNKKAKSFLLSEIDKWAHKHPDAAEEVTRHVCQLSAFDGRTVWQMVTPLGESRRRRGRRRPV